ncbi:hypothetical protein [Pareuzebyella sediminis]|uniref:hypothetical protein n=1 Tax=Pareuzebyella sediminis TaxID=2607998 RepID=UPI0011EDD376|nr:hypothetical protein [Pareuzebyella sediminis]
MRYAIILWGFLLFSACNWSTAKEEKTQELVLEEIQAIDWDDVDQYPLFDDCEEIVTKEERKKCFMETLLTHFSMSLQEAGFELQEEVKDTILVDFIMEDNGSITLMNIHNDEKINAQLPNFRDQIEKCLQNMPRIAPALKRGIPVSAKFRIPIVLSSR